MVLLKLLVFTIVFYELIADLDARCEKGNRKNKGNGCESCPVGQFQPTENHSRMCKVCAICDETFGVIVKACTAEANVKCRCVRGSVPWENDEFTCKCPKGFEKKGNECVKCEAGYFSEGHKTPCKKWKECRFGVKHEGTHASDVVCNEELKANVTTAPTSSQTTSLITRLLPQPPHEGAQTQRTTTTTRTTTRPTTTTTTTDFPDQTEAPKTTSYIGIYLLILIIAGLLIILTTVTCKLHINPCVERKQAVPANDPLCRSPVEESGGGSLSPLKPNPEEP